MDNLEDRKGIEMSVPPPAIVLAAGQSRRWGRGSKLFHRIDGVCVLERTIEALMNGGIERVLVVASPMLVEPVRILLQRLAQVVVVVHPGATAGMGTTIAAGIRALGKQGWLEEGCAISPGDLPWLQAATVAELLQKFEGQRSAVRPVSRGTPGHPVFFPPSWVEELGSLSGDKGARDLLAAQSQSVLIHPVADTGIWRDLDSPASFESETPASSEP